MKRIDSIFKKNIWGFDDFILGLDDWKIEFLNLAERALLNKRPLNNINKKIKVNYE